MTMADALINPAEPRPVENPDQPDAQQHAGSKKWEPQSRTQGQAPSQKGEKNDAGRRGDGVADGVRGGPWSGGDGGPEIAPGAGAGAELPHRDAQGKPSKPNPAGGAAMIVHSRPRRSRQRAAEGGLEFHDQLVGSLRKQKARKSGAKNMGQLNSRAEA